LPRTKPPVAPAAEEKPAGAIEVKPTEPTWEAQPIEEKPVEAAVSAAEEAKSEVVPEPVQAAVVAPEPESINVGSDLSPAP
jgi:hypothetical protein